MPEYSPTSCIASYNIIPFLKKLFSYRHRVIAGDCNWHQRYSKNKPLKIAITDDSGALSSILMSFLSSGGHKILPLSRVPKKGALLWNPDTGELDTNRLESFDAIINLTGESLTSGRWNKAKKAHILQNRVIATKTLCNALLKMKSPPKTFLNASSLGLYGDRGNELITEQSAPGKTFLSEVSLQWEEPLSTLKNKGIRTIALRFGSILTPNHGLLKKMLWAFKHCLGGRIGSGDQYMSWIAIDDVLGAILHILATTSMEGAINLSAPTSITNAEFTETLGTILHRPTLIPLPATISRLFFGEMADALLLNSCRAVPLELEKSGYEFLYPNLRDALNHLL